MQSPPRPRGSLIAFPHFPLAPSSFISFPMHVSSAGPPYSLMLPLATMASSSVTSPTDDLSGSWETQIICPPKCINEISSLFLRFRPHPSTNSYLHSCNAFFVVLILRPPYIMWRRSRAPCFCPSCSTEKLHDQIRDLRGAIRTSGERMDSRLREIQMENQGLRRHNESLQNQLHSQENMHNQEQLGNPLGRLQQPVNSIKSIESRLPSTFCSEVRNEQNQVPLDPTQAPTGFNPKEENPLPVENQAIL